MISTFSLTKLSQFNRAGTKKEHCRRLQLQLERKQLKSGLPNLGKTLIIEMLTKPLVLTNLEKTCIIKMLTNPLVQRKSKSLLTGNAKTKLPKRVSCGHHLKGIAAVKV